jgi:hypothetical protein
MRAVRKGVDLLVEFDDRGGVERGEAGDVGDVEAITDDLLEQDLARGQGDEEDSKSSSLSLSQTDSVIADVGRRIFKSVA